MKALSVITKRFIKEMREEVKSPEQSEEVTPGVCFDPEEAVLEGTYLDELSAYRARRVWTETFETNFLLEPNHDFIFRVLSSLEGRKFVLKCDFATACGRYAFWRLTRNQAPEAQYLIETAHIPQADSRREETLHTADLSTFYHSSFTARFRHKSLKCGDIVANVLARILRKK
jgi:hypothetical protein